MPKSPKLPSGSLSKELHLACEAKTWAELQQRLRQGAPSESCTFALTRLSRGKSRVTVILREIMWPQDNEVKATPYNLEIGSDYISRVMDAAIDTGPLTGVALIHTHPDTEFGKGVGRFSGRDNWYENRLFPTITLDRPRSVSCSVVIGGTTSDIEARAWWNSGSGPRSQAVQIIRTVGPEITFHETPHSRWKDHPDPTIMDRSTRLWGLEGRRILQNLRVGIVGVGGTGSITLLSLATMGVGEIRAWDKDTVAKENLHRLLGTKKSMVGKPKVLAVAPVVRSVATASPFKLLPVPTWGTTSEALNELKDCDLVFCCVDKYAPRVPLNDFAYAHLIPVIDMGSWVHSSNKMVDAIMTHAHVWSPGIPCAWCKQTLTSFRLMQEAQGNQLGIENRAPYGLPLDEVDRTEPSVLPLNMTGVSLALLEFMQVALKVAGRTPRDLKVILPEWELDESDLESNPDCPSENNTGRGDEANITPVQGQ